MSDYSIRKADMFGVFALLIAYHTYYTGPLYA